jgi:hypothetical protein
MAELAPGLYVTSWLDGGTAYVLNEALIGTGSGIGGNGLSIALPEVDWERIDPVRRERILDDFVCRSADWGTDQLQRWLSAEMNQIEESA